VQSIVISVSVCLSVCLHVSKTTRSNFTKLSVHVICRHGLVLLWRQLNTLCTSGLWMMSCFHIMGPVGQNHARRYALSSSPDGGTGGRSCCLQLEACLGEPRWRQWCFVQPESANSLMIGWVISPVDIGKGTQKRKYLAPVSLGSGGNSPTPFRCNRYVVNSWFKCSS